MEYTDAECNEQLKSVIDTPAAPVLDLELAAFDATEGPETVIGDTSHLVVVPSSITQRREKSENEVLLADEDSAEEAMGPQIPTMSLVEDPEIGRTETAMIDPLEFALSYLILYRVLLSEEFVSVQTLVTGIATRLQLSIRQIFRTNVSQGQSLWLKTGSTDQARKLGNYTHH